MIASGATGKYLSNCLLSELTEAMSSPSPAGIDTHCWFTYYDEYEKTEITKVKVIITFTNIKRKQKIVTILAPESQGTVLKNSLRAMSFSEPSPATHPGLSKVQLSPET
jgi:hypothetical protein